MRLLRKGSLAMGSACRRRAFTAEGLARGNCNLKREGREAGPVVRRGWKVRQFFGPQSKGQGGMESYAKEENVGVDGTAVLEKCATGVARNGAPGEARDGGATVSE